MNSHGDINDVTDGNYSYNKANNFGTFGAVDDRRKRKSGSRVGRASCFKIPRFDDALVVTTARIKKLTSKAKAARASYLDGNEMREAEVEARNNSRHEKVETKQVALMKAAALDAILNNKWSTQLVVSSKNDSGYEGVDFHQGRWRARIRTGVTRIVLGRYDSKVEAAQAYAAAFREVPDGMGSKVPSNGGTRTISGEEVNRVEPKKKSSRTEQAHVPSHRKRPCARNNNSNAILALA